MQVVRLLASCILLEPAVQNTSQKTYSGMPVEGWRGGFPPWGLFEVPASSAVMLWVAVEIAGGQDTEPLFHELPGSDEALSPKPQGKTAGGEQRGFGV